MRVAAVVAFILATALIVAPAPGIREPLFSESGLTLRAKVGRQLSKHAARREALPAL